MSNLHHFVSSSVTSSRTNKETSMIATPPTSRTGGPRHSNRNTKRYESYEMQHNVFMHAPLDSDMHWTWNNPLNIIPAMLLLFSLVALLASLMYL